MRSARRGGEVPYVDLEDGGKLYYEEHGEGEPVLFLNGIMMNTLSWADLLPDFVPRMKVILLDFRDQGRSSVLEAPYSLEAHARDVTALLDATGHQSVHVVGLSYGGQVALRLALRQPGRVRSLILSNVVRRISNHLRAIGVAWERAAELNDGERFFQLAIPFIYSARFYETSSDFLAQRQELFKGMLTKEWFEAFVRLAHATEGYEVTLEELAAIRIPTLLVGADDDVIAPIAGIDEIQAAIQGSEMLVLRRAGHGAFLERRHEFATAVTGFVAKHS